MPLGTAALAELRKILVAALVRKNTSAGNRWLADRLAMGHTAGVSRILGQCRNDKEILRKLAKLEEML